MATSLEDALKEAQKAEPTMAKADDGGGAPPESAEPPAETEAKPEGGETPEPQAEAEDVDRPRDPKTGRFADHVPYASYKSEKSKRKELEKAQAEWAKERDTLSKDAQEAKALRERIAAMEAAARQPPQYQQQPQRPAQQPQQQRLHPVLEQRLADMEMDVKVKISEANALREFGRDAINAAGRAYQEAAARNPYLRAQFVGSADPVGDVVRWHKRELAYEKLGGDPDAYIEAQVAARLEAMRNAPPQQQKQKPPVNIPTDLSSAPNVGTRTGANWTGPTSLKDALR
jgi:hypothetical protein